MDEFPKELAGVMAAMGRKGGLASGAKRMQMPASERSRIASLAASARWGTTPKTYANEKRVGCECDDCLKARYGKALVFCQDCGHAYADPGATCDDTQWGCRKCGGPVRRRFAVKAS